MIWWIKFKFTVKESEEYSFAIDLTKNAFAFLKENVPIDSMHEAACFVELYEYLESEKITDIINLEEFRKVLEIQINYSITKDVSN